MEQETGMVARASALLKRARAWLNRPRFGIGKPKVRQGTPAPAAVDETPAPSTRLDTEAAMEPAPVANAERSAPAPETEAVVVAATQWTQKVAAVEPEESPDPLGDPSAEDGAPTVVAVKLAAAPEAQAAGSGLSSEAAPAAAEPALPAQEAIIGLNEAVSSPPVDDKADAPQAAPPETFEPEIGPLQDAIQEVMRHATEINTAVHKALFLVNTTKAQADAWLRKAGQDLEETQRTKQQAIECLDAAKEAKRDAEQWLEQASRARTQAIGCLEEARATRIAAQDRRTLLDTEALRPLSSATMGSEQPAPPPPPAEPRPEPRAEAAGEPGPASNDAAGQAAGPEAAVDLQQALAPHPLQADVVRDPPPVPGGQAASPQAIVDLQQPRSPHALQADVVRDPPPVPAIGLFDPPAVRGGQAASPEAAVDLQQALAPQALQAQRPAGDMLIITQEELDAVEEVRVQAIDLQIASAKAAREAKSFEGGQSADRQARDELQRSLQGTAKAGRRAEDDRRKAQDEIQRAEEARAEAANQLARDDAERMLRQAADAKKQAENDRRQVQQELRRAEEARAEAEKLQQDASQAANGGGERMEAANQLARDEAERVLREATDAKKQAEEDRRQARQELEQARAVRLMASRVHQRPATGDPSEPAPTTAPPDSNDGADGQNAPDASSGAGVEFHIATEEDLLAQLKAHQERQRKDPSGRASR